MINKKNPLAQNSQSKQGLNEKKDAKPSSNKDQKQEKAAGRKK